MFDPKWGDDMLFGWDQLSKFIMSTMIIKKITTDLMYRSSYHIILN